MSDFYTIKEQTLRNINANEYVYNKNRFKLVVSKTK